jgi:hypothetical protein
MNQTGTMVEQLGGWDEIGGRGRLRSAAPQAHLGVRRSFCAKMCGDSGAGEGDELMWFCAPRSSESMVPIPDRDAHECSQ